MEELQEADLIAATGARALPLLVAVNACGLHVLHTSGVRAALPSQRP